jgi:hypothetical protein
MHQRTISTLDQLESANWFARIGQCESPNVKCLYNWEQAIAGARNQDWKALRHEAANQYRTRLRERDVARFYEWNTHVREIKKVTIPLVRRKIEDVVSKNKLPQDIIDAVQWDVLHVCMEAEYADVFPPGFYASQAYWYVEGHFPCGWEGTFPNGRPVVF